MKRLLCGLLALLLLTVACPDAGAVSVTYSWAFDFHDDVPLRVRLPGGEKQGLVHLVTGKWVIPPRFDEVKRFSTMISMGNDYLDDLVAVKVDGKWGIAETEGNLLVAPQYSTVMYEGEGLLSAETDGKRGILDRQGRMLIVPRFDLIDDFAGGMARVKEGEVWLH